MGAADWRSPPLPRRRDSRTATRAQRCQLRPLRVAAASTSRSAPHAALGNARLRFPEFCERPLRRHRYQTGPQLPGAGENPKSHAISRSTRRRCDGRPNANSIDRRTRSPSRWLSLTIFEIVLLFFFPSDYFIIGHSTVDRISRSMRVIKR